VPTVTVPTLTRRRYELDLTVRDERATAALLVRLTDEPGENWLDETFNGNPFEMVGRPARIHPHASRRSRMGARWQPASRRAVLTAMCLCCDPLFLCVACRPDASHAGLGMGDRRPPGARPAGPGARALSLVHLVHFR
jgi:hypothetical protein